MQNSTGQEEVEFVAEPKLEITAAIDQDNLSNNKTYNAEKPFQCEFCARVYEKVKQLKKHQYRCIQKPKVLRKCEEIYGSTHLYELVIENNKSNPQCFICEKVFSDKWALTNHVKFVHEKKKNFECLICKKRFGTNALKERHIKQVHEKQKRFECQFCKKKFPQAQNLDGHIKGVHERLKPYKCDTCGNNFTQSSSLSLHYKIIHRQNKINNIPDQGSIS